MDLRDAASIISGKSTARDPNSNDLTVRVGVITAVGAGVVSITLGGDTTVIPNVRYLNSYSPNVGDVVQVIVNGTALLIIGSVTATPLTSYAPTLTQGVSVSYSASPYAKWRMANKWVTAQVSLVVSSTGTASGQIFAGLPVAGVTNNIVIGTVAVYSGGLWYNAPAYMNTSSTVGGLRDGTANFIGSAPALTLVAGNVVQIDVHYEAA